MRIQVNVSDEMVEKVDAIAKDMGMSRSALCTYYIGLGVYGMSKAVDVASQFARTTIEKLDTKVTEVTEGE